MGYLYVLVGIERSHRISLSIGWYREVTLYFYRKSLRSEQRRLSVKQKNRDSAI